MLPVQRCTSWRNMALLPQIVGTVGHGFLQDRGSKWSEHVLEMAEKKWATWGYNFTARSGVMGPYLQLENLLCLEIFCVTNKKIIATKEVNRKKKQNTSWEKGGNFLPIPCEMGGFLFVTKKGLGLSDSRCTIFFFYKEHLASNIPW